MEQLKSMPWEPNAKKKFDDMTSRIPLFHRKITQEVVEKQAVINARERKSPQVEESDIIRAFLSEVPAAFYNIMIRLMDHVGFDYHPYESK